AFVAALITRLLTWSSFSVRRSTKLVLFSCNSISVSSAASSPTFPHISGPSKVNRTVGSLSYGSSIPSLSDLFVLQTSHATVRFSHSNRRLGFGALGRMCSMSPYVTWRNKLSQYAHFPEVSTNSAALIVTWAYLPSRYLDGSSPSFKICINSAV